jgi:SulP family sulfate permease
MTQSAAAGSRLKSAPLGTGLYTGIVLALFTLVASLSFGSLIFSGELAAGVADGMGIALVSALVVGLVVAWKSSAAAIIAIPQDRTAPILALMAAQVAAGLPADTPLADKLINVLMAIALTTVLTGVVLYLLGHYRLGNLTRFIPYPVAGGFLCGSGWLLVVGSFRVMTGKGLTVGALAEFCQPALLSLWLPGAALGVVLFVVMRRFRRPKLVPLLLLGAVLVFHLLLVIFQVQLGQAQAAGWLPVIPAGEDFRPHLWSWEALKLLDASALLRAVGLAATVAVTAALSILLNSSAFELTVRQEIDLNRELRAAGVANLAAGLAGGMLGFQSLSLSRLAHDLGARTRLAAVVAALGCGAVLWVGPAAFTGLPKFALGALLLYLGLGFLVEYLYDAWARLPISDYAVVVLIAAVMGTVGYLEGVGVGVLAAVFLFIHNYSRVGVITHALSGVELQSNVDRPVVHQRLLREEGGRLFLLKLQGFIFFGTANSLLHSIRARMADSKLAPLGCVILDFRRVSGLDSSAALSLAKAGQLARSSRFSLLLTQVPAEMRAHLQRSFVSDTAGEAPQFFPDLDHALEWWEERMLVAHAAEAAAGGGNLQAQLIPYWPRTRTLELLLGRLERRTFVAGQYLIRQGGEADAIYFIESGEVSTVLEGANGSPPRRLRRQGAGTVLGELGMLLRQPRSASVLVNQPTVVFSLTEAALAALKFHQPEVAADFFEFLSRYLSERVINTTKSLRVLTD